jgi:hypothetical protein
VVRLAKHKQHQTLFLAALVGGLVAFAALGASCSDGGSDDDRAGRDAVAVETPTTESVKTLGSFHYVATLRVAEKQHNTAKGVVEISTEGDFQQPDRHAFTYTTRVDDDSLRRSAVVIGDAAWMRRNDGDWRSVTIANGEFLDLVTTAFSSIKPDFLGGPAFEGALESVRRLPSTLDPVNGVAAHRYVVRAEGQPFFASLLANENIASSVENAEWELWLAEDGAWPVRIVARATLTDESALTEQFGLNAPTSWELRIDISRPNDPALVVAPPQ